MPQFLGQSKASQAPATIANTGITIATAISGGHTTHCHHSQSPMVISDELFLAAVTALTGAASAYGSIRARLSTLERHSKDYHAFLERVHDTVLWTLRLETLNMPAALAWEVPQSCVC